MKSDHDTEFDSLLSKLADDVAQPKDLQRLEGLLQGDSARQAQYFDWLSTHLLLEQEGAIRSEIEQTPQPVEKPSVSKQAPKAPTRSKRSSLGSDSSTNPGVRYALAALVLLVAGGFVANRVFQSDVVTMATVVDAVGIVDGPRELTVEGSVLDVGLPVNFGAGVLSIAMPSGAEFTLEGPASVVVAGENQVRLDQGKLYAKVPPSGVGFTVETPSASMIDLGTEFGVITRADGASDSYVFVGEVRAEAGDSSAELEAGQAIAATTADGLSPVREFDRSKVRFMRSINGTEYIDTIAVLDPLYLHRFAPSSKQRRFYNALGDVRYPISVRGGVYASAGGPIATPNAADGYLRFVGVESTSVAGSVSKSLEKSGAYSIVLWVRVDEPGAQGLAAFTSDFGPDVDLGSLLRITKEGNLEHRCHSASDEGRFYVSQRSSKPLPLGVWAQVVFSGGSQRELNLYVNGELAAAPVRFDDSIRSDCGRLVLGSGSDRRLGTGLDTGPLRGAIDELAVFDRQLTAKEIGVLYQTSNHRNMQTTF